MQHKHMVYGELCIHHFLVLDQKENDNAYSNPLVHEVWNADHKMAMMCFNLCYNAFSNLGVKHQHYPEHDTIYLSMFFPWIVYCKFPVQKHHFCGAILSDGVEN